MIECRLVLSFIPSLCTQQKAWLTMDEIIDTYIQGKFSPELGEEIYQLFGLMRVFGYLEPLDRINNLLMRESILEPDAVQDTFTTILDEAQDYLLDKHTIVVNEDASLSLKNAMLRALFQIQNLEDPLPVLRIIESMASDEEKFARIFEHMTTISSTEFISVLTQVRPTATRLLSELLYSQEENQQKAVPVLTSLRKRLTAYKEVFGINEAVRTILDADVIIGEKFELYLPMFNELRELITDEKMLLETLLFLLFYSEDGSDHALTVFDQYSDQLVTDLNDSVRINRALSQMVSKVDMHNSYKDLKA